MDSSLAIWIVYAAWAVLIVFLTATAFSAKRDTETHLGQSFALLFALVVAFLLPRLPIFGFVNFAPISPAVSLIGLGLMFAGMAVLVAGRLHLGGNWSQTVSAKQGHELVTSGPYRWVRHPMYAGGLLACIGSVLVAGGAFVFLLILLGAIFIWRVVAEDKLLAAQFPRAFPAYKARTWALIPFVY
jgi:protein-S-isoprenylcysteine O-methyltransferase Ste14